MIISQLIVDVELDCEDRTELSENNIDDIEAAYDILDKIPIKTLVDIYLSKKLLKVIETYQYHIKRIDIVRIGKKGAV